MMKTSKEKIKQRLQMVVVEDNTGFLQNQVETLRRK